MVPGYRRPVYVDWGEDHHAYANAPPPERPLAPGTIVESDWSEHLQLAHHRAQRCDSN